MKQSPYPQGTLTGKMDYEQAMRMAQESPRYSESYLDEEVAVREKLPWEGRPQHTLGKERRAF